ncbi:hypothetical protein BDZ45DRAFT_34929 [Acephala macrosclerotiorum]|nr:hypothetical protein BDZ45DRAFT_34929 [Acephala macrosclerotiorum]
MPVSHSRFKKLHQMDKQVQQRKYVYQLLFLQYHGQEQSKGLFSSLVKHPLGSTFPKAESSSPKRVGTTSQQLRFYLLDIVGFNSGFTDSFQLFHRLEPCVSTSSGHLLVHLHLQSTPQSTTYCQPLLHCSEIFPDQSPPHFSRVPLLNTTRLVSVQHLILTSQLSTSAIFKLSVQPTCSGANLLPLLLNRAILLSNARRRASMRSRCHLLFLVTQSRVV